MFMRAIVCLLLLSPVALAADIDPRAEVTIQVSPLEAVSVWGRVYSKDTKITSEAQSDALMRIGKALDFDGITAKVQKLAATKKQPTNEDFKGPRTSRKIARDALDQLVMMLVPTADKPIPMELDGLFRKLRFEMREVLAGRNPY